MTRKETVIVINVVIVATAVVVVVGSYLRVLKCR